jgi:hypothetical protein
MVAIIALAAACGSGDDGGDDAGEGTESTGESTGGVSDACEVIAGQTYASVEELECGVGPGGPDLCKWTIEFDTSGHFAWYFSDTMESGSYYCNGLTVVATGASMSFQSTLDPVTGVLTWDGEDYEVSP